jgi:hypothetical protein
MVRQRLGEWWVLVQVTAHTGEERDQLAFLIDPDPNRHRKSASHIEIAVFIDLGLEKCPPEQFVEGGKRDGILRNDGRLGSPVGSILVSDRPRGHQAAISVPE